MGLGQYQAKRKFTKTPEPKGRARAAKAKPLRFVVQKHQATQLHYDFRLEVDGVLKSWAIPKGPSANPADKRLAMAVEDHPYEYRDFEGVIPEGNYGGGTVMVWDRGTYTPLDHHTFKAPPLGGRSAEVTKQLADGALKIKLRGMKLQGIYNVVKFNRPGMKNGWLLIKHPDDFTSTEDLTTRDRSVKSGRSLPEIAEAKG